MDTSVKRHYLVFSGLLIGSVVIVYFVLPFFGLNPIITSSTTPITGVSVYAIIYLMAQLDERMVEPFSNIDSLFGTREDKDVRTFSLWCLASIIGIILCYFTTGLFQIVGITFAFNSHSLDAIFSAY